MLFFVSVLFVTLLALAIIDLKTLQLPNILTLPLIVVGFGFSYLIRADLLASLIGALLGYCGFALIEIGYRAIKGQDGLGRGDAKLLAVGGAWCGWFGLPFIILIASLFGLAHAVLLNLKHNEKIRVLPFGPHLAIGIALTWLAINLA